MPIDYYKGEWYKFDFKNLSENFKKINNEKKFFTYLKDWTLLLENLNKKSTLEYQSFIKKYVFNESIPEIYQFKQVYKGNINAYIFNFNIDNVIKTIKTKVYKKKTSFVKKITSISSYNHDILLDQRKIKEDPIILCKMPTPEYEYAVIDGNTRLNYFLKRNKIFIRYFVYDINSKKDFFSAIDWATYNYIMEINEIIENSKCNIENYIKNSKIYNQKFLEETSLNNEPCKCQ